MNIKSETHFKFMSENFAGYVFKKKRKFWDRPGRSLTRAFSNSFSAGFELEYNTRLMLKSTLF